MVTPTPLDWQRIAARGVVAGLIGGVLFDASLYAALLLRAYQSLPALWQPIGAPATGAPATGHTVASSVLGYVIGFCVSIAWGIGYAYAASTREAIARHPYISGPVFGFIVMVIMQIVWMAGGVYMPALTAAGFITQLVAHCLFFGLPIALYLNRATRT
jgi:hypothetical protein